MTADAPFWKEQDYLILITPDQNRRTFCGHVRPENHKDNLFSYPAR